MLPAAVGGDIGCGMAAVAFDAEASVLGDEVAAARLLAALQIGVPVLKRRRATSLPPNLGTLSHPALRRRADREGRHQLGTLGRGNHFVEFQADDGGRLWLMVHSGSRGMGAAIRDHHEGPFDATTPAGEAYLQDHDWALGYAEANRRLREVQEKKKDLAALVVHDLRNPLSVLQGNIDLLYE